MYRKFKRFKVNGKDGKARYVTREQLDVIQSVASVPEKEVNIKVIMSDDEFIGSGYIEEISDTEAANLPEEE